jgi:hypothetical protein
MVVEAQGEKPSTGVFVAQDGKALRVEARERRVETGEVGRGLRYPRMDGRTNCPRLDARRDVDDRREDRLNFGKRATRTG